MGVFPWFPPISLVRWWIVNCNLLGNPRDKKGLHLTNLLAAITSQQPSPPNLGSSLDRNQPYQNMATASVKWMNGGFEGPHFFHWFETPHLFGMVFLPRPWKLFQPRPPKGLDIRSWRSGQMRHQDSAKFIFKTNKDLSTVSKTTTVFFKQTGDKKALYIVGCLTFGHRWDDQLEL